MNMVNPSALVPPLLALQFVVFGWRITREVSLGDEGRRTWLLFSDFLNLAGMVAVVSFCVVLPLKTASFTIISRTIRGAGYVLICFTPLIIAGHYRLFSREGRSIYERSGRDYPWITGQEAVLIALAVLSAASAAYFIALT
jgi:hypothetical protein